MTRPAKPSSPPQNTLLLTCEHGGNLVPECLAPHFAGRARLLHSHRGWDPGALELAAHLAATLNAPLIGALISRLVVDLNRSLDNPTLFSPITAALDPASRDRILRTLYTPYRARVERHARAHARTARPLLHLSIHTFTPVLRGRRRTVDIGILFDPARPRERTFAEEWRRALSTRLPRLTVRLNQPYRGTDDGLTSHLRARLPDAVYAGIELEVNQRFPRRPGPAWDRLRRAVADSLTELLA